MLTPTQIVTARFILRPLEISDASDRYVEWLQDQAAQQFIVAAATSPDLAALRQYVKARTGREDVLFLGIFEKTSGIHIGNIKYEPVDKSQGYAIMGILIGEPVWRGKSVAAEVIKASAKWLLRHRGIRQIILGVSRTNTAAIRAYEKIGFVKTSSKFIPTQSSDCLTMTWDITP